MIKAASLFQTAGEEEAVNQLIDEAAKSEKMRLLAEEARKRAAKASKEGAPQELGVTMEYADEQSDNADNPMDWIDVDNGLRDSLHWNSASLDNLNEDPSYMKHQKSIQ